MKKVIILALLLAIVQGVWADITYIERSWNGSEVVSTYKTLQSGEYIYLEGSPGQTLNLEAGKFYFVDHFTTNYDRLVCPQGTVNLIIRDGARLYCQITVNKGSTLNIFPGPHESGELYATSRNMQNGGNMYKASAAIGMCDNEGMGELNIHGCEIVADATLHSVAAIGGGFTEREKWSNCGTINIYGGKVTAKGGKWGAGIGGGLDGNGGTVNIYGGTVEAHGGEYGPGIGGGQKASGGTVNIWGGTVKAYGGTDAAGIGCGEQQVDYPNGGYVYIHGGTVEARGGKYGAGIGGGQDASGATVEISGGTVRAYGGTDAAGIGSGEETPRGPALNGGKLTVTGGTVFADGTDWAAGIGGGEDADGATVVITGGTVMAWAGQDAGKDGGLAIGGGDTDEGRGSLRIGDKMMVHAGQNPDDANSYLFSYGERVPACFYRPYTRIEPCTHAKGSYTINGTGENDTHTLKCPNCLDRSSTKHTFENSRCTVCGAKGTTFTIHVYLPNTSASAGTYAETQTLTMASGSSLTLPVPPAENEPAGMEFAGWLQSTSAPSMTSWATQSGETLLNDGSDITISSPTYLTARYKVINVTLNDATDNGETIDKFNGKTVSSVTLSGRTLYKDGNWNTLILPFDVTTFTGTPLEGAEIRMFDSENCSFDASTGLLTINFTTLDSDGIKAGYPFLVKWTSGNNIVNPVFNNVKIDQSMYETTSDVIDFVGVYSPKVIYRTDTLEDNSVEQDKTYLYLGAGNTLYYPTATGFKVNSLRAYFRLKNGLTAGDPDTNAPVRAFKLNLGDDVTGIMNTNLTNNTNDEAWYDLSGRKIINGQLSRGIYINNGRKIVIK